MPKCGGMKPKCDYFFWNVVNYLFLSIKWKSWFDYIGYLCTCECVCVRLCIMLNIKLCICHLNVSGVFFPFQWSWCNVRFERCTEIILMGLSQLVMVSFVLPFVPEFIRFWLSSLSQSFIQHHRFKHWWSLLVSPLLQMSKKRWKYYFTKASSSYAVQTFCPGSKSGKSKLLEGHKIH